MKPFVTAEAFAPASVANLGVGFDILGLALQEPGDLVRAELLDTPGVAIETIEGDEGRLSRDPQRNTAGIAALALLNMLKAPYGVRLAITKRLPLASGLGSSAASAVAAAVAVNALLGEPLPREALLPACLAGEAAVSGYHADNVGPSLLGGITLITGTEVGDILHLPVPPLLHLALVTPYVEVPTAQARAVLPASVPLKTMVTQTGAVARLIDALYRDDLQALAHAMEADSVVEPARLHLMPMLREVRAAAKRAGALGLIISGAGPTLCAVCGSFEVAEAVMLAMKAVYDEVGIGSSVRCTQVSQVGAKVVSVR